ncbi:MAG: phosphatidate cytidylyltransferase, partial [Gemmatimonadota bacterium]|nr:phosphatidate cytidylyltransferase [Gemmatimonadota bacterium]
LSVAAALGAWEYNRLAAAAGARPLMAVGVVLAAVVPLLLHAARLGLWVPPLPIVALIVPALLTAALWIRGVEGKPIASVATTLFGVFYTGGMLSFAYALRYHRFAVGELAGALLLLLPLVLTWANDVGAYFVGRALGKRKLMPSISPGKTVAGAVGGLALTIVAAWVYARFALQPRAGLGLTAVAILLLGTIVSVAAQVGDLVESMLKREAGVKDSSALIPGHGGVLDRTDSLLFTIPVTYVLLDLLLVVRP